MRISLELGGSLARRGACRNRDPQGRILLLDVLGPAFNGGLAFGDGAGIVESEALARQAFKCLDRKKSSRGLSRIEHSHERGKVRLILILRSVDDCKIPCARGGSFEAGLHTRAARGKKRQNEYRPSHVPMVSPPRHPGRAPADSFVDGIPEGKASFGGGKLSLPLFSGRSP